MAKVSIDIDFIKKSLLEIGYIISDCLERENNGLNWQLKFSNSGACVTIYDTNNKKNSVVNGKCNDEEKRELKELVDGLKCKEMTIDPINQEIVSLINSKREGSFYDFKLQWHEKGKDCDLLHDILCFANNVDFRDSYLIVGVKDNGDVIGVKNWRKSNEVIDLLKSKRFAGNNMPQIEIRKTYYMYHKIDVLIIKSTDDVPYYLEEKFKDVGMQIYTRVGDTNTPKNQIASYNDIEVLWKKHFKMI